LSFIDLLKHSLSFVAPALGVALLVTLGARIVLPRSGRPRNWCLALLLNFVTGVLVLAAGLWFFGRDGKMATYVALVLVVASCQWLSGRAWRP
jgi:hypothetical protein